MRTENTSFRNFVQEVGVASWPLLEAAPVRARVPGAGVGNSNDDAEATAAGGRGQALVFRPAPRREIFLDQTRTVPLYAKKPPAPAITCDQLKALAIPILVVQGEHT